jgi:hypothetical protein
MFKPLESNRAIGRTVFAVTIGLVVLLCPAMVAPASAATVTVGTDNFSPQLEFEVGGSHGYSISVSNYGSRVILTANGLFTSGGYEAASYTVAGRVTAHGLRARFGNRGRISVEFRPSGGSTRQVPPRRCIGRPRVTRVGTFVGTIRFRGEHGYTNVDAVRARGSIHVPRRWRCKRRHGHHRPVCTPGKNGPSEAVSLVAENRLQGRSFEVYSERPLEERGTTLLMVSSRERRGQMRVERVAFANARERTFTYAPGLSSATVSPPSPFEGWATFQRNADRSTTWKGNLSVSLLGAPHMSLTGSNFNASLSRPTGGHSSFCGGFYRR